MRREDAEAERQRLQRDDHQHTYVLREHPSGEWQVGSIDIPRRPLYAAAERRAESPPTDADQAAELADAERRSKALRERRARLVNIPAAPPEDPHPSPIRLPPGFG